MGARIILARDPASDHTFAVGPVQTDKGLAGLEALITAAGYQVNEVVDIVSKASFTHLFGREGRGGS